MTPNVNLVRSQLLENAFMGLGVENSSYKIYIGRYNGISEF
jgi:hypothetical protein